MCLIRKRGREIEREKERGNDIKNKHHDIFVKYHYSINITVVLFINLMICMFFVKMEKNM